MKPASGKRLFIITSSGGSGILAVDQAEKLGLEIPTLASRVVDKLKAAGISPNATLSNPLDLTVAGADAFEKAMGVIVAEDVADNYLLIFGDPIPGVSQVSRAIQDRLKGRIAVSYLGGGAVEKHERQAMHEAGIPVFPTPDRAVVAIEGAIWANNWLED
jgi:acyl-CoA synthetase (NDP forming)